VLESTYSTRDIRTVRFDMTTTVGIRSKDGVVLAADKRASKGFFVGSKVVQKIFSLDGATAVAIAGAMSDAEYLVNLAKAERRLLALRRGYPLSVKESAKLISNIVYSSMKSYNPFYVELVVAGVDREGAHVYTSDMSGAITSEDFMSSGSGSPIAYGVLEQGFRKEFSLDEARKLAEAAVRAAMERDPGSGNGVDVLAIPNGHAFGGEDLDGLGRNGTDAVLLQPGRPARPGRLRAPGGQPRFDDPRAEDERLRPLVEPGQTDAAPDGARREGVRRRRPHRRDGQRIHRRRDDAPRPGPRRGPATPARVRRADRRRDAIEDLVRIPARVHDVRGAPVRGLGPLGGRGRPGGPTPSGGSERDHVQGLRLRDRSVLRRSPRDDRQGLSPGSLGRSGPRLGHRSHRSRERRQVRHRARARHGRIEAVRAPTAP